MSRDYKEISIHITGEEERAQLIARLEAIGFESFVEEEDELQAYVGVDLFEKKRLEEVLKQAGLPPDYQETLREDKNWNEEWEKNYPPVLIGGKCYIRAPFHPASTEYPYELIIEPRMAFGTAHHETTAMMIEWELETDLRGKLVLDMGCGTGILAILANKMGAADVMAVDNDEWAYLNAIDNILLNDTGNCSAYLDDITALEDKEFDVILANINRNILLQDLSGYAKPLRPGGLLFLSGFYEADIDAITAEASLHGLVPAGRKTKAAWASLCFRKKES